MEVSGQLHPGETAPDTHSTEGWVGPRLCLDAMAKRKDPCPCLESNPSHPARSLVTVFRRKSEGKRPLGRRRRRWDDNIGCGRETGDYKNN